MRKTRRGAAMLLMGGAVCAGVIVGAAGEAAATCVAPTVSVAPARGAPGSVAVVSGRYFYSTCNDTVVNGVAPAPNSPAKGITIAFVQDGRKTTLRTIDAAGDGSFSVSAVIPTAAHGGSAQFSASVPVNIPQHPPTSQTVDSQTFTVVAGPAELAATGSGSVRLPLAGLLLLACGAAVLVANRRARPRSTSTT